MIRVVDLPFVEPKSGKITLTSPSTYEAALGSAMCMTGQDVVLTQNWRAYFNFDTSVLPDGARVTGVAFLLRVPIYQPIGNPATYRLKFSIGTFIGATLDGNSAEWNAGALMKTLTAKPTDNTWLDLAAGGTGAENYVNRAGDTDLKVWDDSLRGGGDLSWGLNLNTPKAKCQLRVTYQVPSGTATGRGTALGAARVRAAGGGTATGAGLAEASAWVASVASGVATGRGTAVAVAGVRIPGSGLATGYGEALAVAWVLASGQVLATGYGAAACRLSAAYTEPVARHEGTRAVRAAHAASRSVAWADARTCNAGGRT